MAAFVSLFDQLGVSPDASDADVEIAYERMQVEAEGSGAAVNNGLTYAYRILRTRSGRQAYVEFLRHCDERVPIEVPPERRDEFRAFWAFAGIRSWPDPNQPSLIHLRRSDQEPPGFTFAAPPAKPLVRSAARAVWGFLTLRPFVGASGHEKIGLLIMYALVVAAVAYGIDWASSRVGEWQQSRLRASVENRLAIAESSLSELQAVASRFEEEFQTTTGFPLGDTSRSREVDQLILTDPTVSEAWADIENLRLKGVDLAKVRDALSQIKGRVVRAVYQSEDNDELERLINWCANKRQSGRTLDGKLEHVRAMLRITRFDASLDETERTPP